MACYKKILNVQPTIKDLREIMPQMASSLEFILECEDPNLEFLFYQTFTVELDVFGSS